MLVARRFVISGRVQGVGFRYFTQECALREGVTGWVRNLPDGRVEAHVEGESESVTRIERALRSGPGGARVAVSQHATIRDTVPSRGSAGHHVDCGREVERAPFARREAQGARERPVAARVHPAGSVDPV